MGLLAEPLRELQLTLALARNKFRQGSGGQGPPLFGPQQRGQQRGGWQDDNDGRCRNDVTINLPAKDEKRRLTRGGGNKRRCRLTTGGRGNVMCWLMMGGRDNKRRRL